MLFSNAKYSMDISNIKNQEKTCSEELMKILEKLNDKEVFGKYFKGFFNLFCSFLNSSSLKWEEIKQIPEEKLLRYDSLSDVVDFKQIQDNLKRLVVVKLNGGLGTTMGCSYPKSLITVRDGMTFLDIILLYMNHINEKYDSHVPLVLMNSYSTDQETKRVIWKYGNARTKILTFMQSQYPRINGDSLNPICNDETIKDHSCWYPPGHGNFYESFYESGLMKKFIDEGRDVIFVSNIDNLGATVDFKILNMACNGSECAKKVDFIMEVTDKTKADVKGGTLIMHKNKVRLLEIAQVPKNNVEDFKSINNFRVFNTNNIWMNLRAVYDNIIVKPLELDVICNRKILNNGTNIIQLETAIGAAIVNFHNSIGINVPRARFLPVKNNSDLFLVMSNLYNLDHGILTMSTKREFKTTPLIQLSGPHFKTVKDFMSRFVEIPDILELDYLSVSGDVYFDRNISLKGTVIVLAQHGDHIDIPRGSVLENKIISGNLRVIDH